MAGARLPVRILLTIKEDIQIWGSTGYRRLLKSSRSEENHSYKCREETVVF